MYGGVSTEVLGLQDSHPNISTNTQQLTKVKRHPAQKKRLKSVSVVHSTGGMASGPIAVTKSRENRDSKRRKDLDHVSLGDVGHRALHSTKIPRVRFVNYSILLLTSTGGVR